MKRKFKNLALALVRCIKNMFMSLNKHIICIMLVTTVFFDLLSLCCAIKSIYTKNPNRWFWFVFFIVNIITLSLFAILTVKEHKRENSYMSNFWVITWLFIFVVTIFPIVQQLTIFSPLNKKNIDSIFIWAFVIMVIAWIIYLETAIRSKRKTKNIDLTELKIIFSKSVLQSIVSFIALFGLSSSFLSNGLLLFALITDIYAAYIYPILDINKYVREKEIEQVKDKNKTIIYFFK